MDQGYVKILPKHLWHGVSWNLNLCYFALVCVLIHIYALFFSLAGCYTNCTSKSAGIIPTLLLNFPSRCLVRWFLNIFCLCFLRIECQVFSGVSFRNDFLPIFVSLLFYSEKSCSSFLHLESILLSLIKAKK